MTVPQEVGLTVLEETPTARYLVLPPAPTGRAGELLDAELDAVAGGGLSTFGDSCTANYVPGHGCQS